MQKRRRLKKPIRIALMVLSILFIMAILSISYYGFMLSRVSSKSNNIEFTVTQGESISNIVSNLKDKNLIRSEFAVKMYIKLNNINNLQAGVYDLNNSYSSKEIVNILIAGNVSTKNEINITFKEGLNMRGIAKVISEKTSNTENDVFNLLKDKTYIDSLTSKYWFITNDVKNTELYYPLEGYLFPDTYRFKDKNVDVKTIFASMLNQMNIILTKYKSSIDKQKLSVHQLLTLASIVELEGKFNEDRAMIAGVFYNRLNAGWSLGSDVTTYYANKLDMASNPEISQAALDYNSPYNTRLKSMAGKLPVGPICNPGEASIKATILPTTSDYYYFVADCRTMKTVFTKTDAEHLTAVNAIKASGCKF